MLILLMKIIFIIKVKLLELIVLLSIILLVGAFVAWMKLVNNAMETDSSWKKSAIEYIKVYEDIVNQKG